MADPTTWTPKFEESQIRELIGQYQINPTQFDDKDDDIEVLEDHAQHYRIPFARNKTHQDSYLTRMIKQAGRGWAEGFSTLPMEKVDDFLGTSLGGEAEDTHEAIARNLGHLAGFVGYLPGAKALRELGALKLAGAVSAIKGKSAPMLAANFAQRKVGKAVAPFIKDLPKWATEGVVSDMAQGAFHLGAASAASSWTHGVNEMFSAAGFGVGAGAVFRYIGNMKGFGERLKPSQLKQNGSPNTKLMSEGQIFDLTARTMSGAAFQGLPSTLQGATTEEQVYAYVMGAFFGYKEMPYQTRTSREFLHKSIKDDHGPDPEMNPRYDAMTNEMQKIIKSDFNEFFGEKESQHLVYDLVKGKGLDIKDIENLANEYKTGMEIDPVSGEAYSKALSQSEIKAYKEAFIKDPRYDESQDLDMHIQDIVDIPGRLVGKGGYIEQVFPDITPVERIKLADNIYKKWSTLHNATTKKPKQGAEQEIISYIETETGRKLDENESGWWKRWAENTRKKQWVEQIEIRDGEVGMLAGKTNSVGNKKDLSQQKMLIEEIYEKSFEAVTGQKPQAEWFRVLDHIIWKDKEYDLGRAERNIARQQELEIRSNVEGSEGMTGKEIKELAKGNAKRIMAESNRKLHDKMAEDGYYYFGGKGDAKKKYFVKLHPLIEKNPELTKRLLKKSLAEFRGATNKKSPNSVRNNRQNYENAFDRWINAEGMEHNKMLSKRKAKLMYEEQYVSNILYEISNNGYDASEAMFSKSFAKLLDGGKYINDPKAFNKRAQIWFNSGLSANPREIQKYLESKGVNDLQGTGTSQRKFRVGLFKEADARYDQEKINLSDGAEKYLESSDGAILAREEVVDALNWDKGLPTDGKLNKSFIVSKDPVLGALLGKYAIQAATPELSDYMKKRGIHMLIPESAAKQVGERKGFTGELDLVPNLGTKELEINFNGDLFDVPIRDFRTVMSEITTKKYLKKVQLPKQMYSVLSAYGYNNIKPESIADMYETLSNRALVGTPEGIKILEAYKGNKNKETINQVVNNMEDIPLNELFDLIRSPNHPELSQKLYEKILKLNHEYVASLAEEGEMSRSDLEKYKEGVADFESVIGRLNKVFPDGSIGAYMHKFSRDYRMQAMRNYVVQKITKPKIDNSASSRMRPWEIGMQMAGKNTAELRYNQEIFFLDDGFRDLQIKDTMFKNGQIKLGELWETRNDYTGALKEKVNDILMGTVMRVPMDSASGAHSLKFAGFTGVKGFGSLLHPRSMKALGGADLDGDKALIFFGGESSGFKKSWREMYASQKDEYVDANLNAERHNKGAIDPLTGESYAFQLAVKDPELEALSKHQVSQYSPYWRQFMSDGASNGRDFLGVAVTSRMAVLGAYNAMRGTGDNAYLGFKTGNYSSSDVYRELGNKTASGNVVIKSVYQKSGVAYAKSIGGVFSMRVNNSEKHFGNPFSSVPAEIAKGLTATKTVKESVEKYIDWVLHSKDTRAAWIRKVIKSGKLKGKPIVYYKEKNAPSHATALDHLINSGVYRELGNTYALPTKNLFTVEPIQSVDKKAKSKAKIATQYIGFAEGITGSSTALYAKQISEQSTNKSNISINKTKSNIVNSGNYSSNDVIFVSIGGKRGDVATRKQQQDKTIREALKAIEAGATLITDNAAYVKSNSYNEGEKRLAANLETKGYNYSEITVDGNLLGVWSRAKANKDYSSDRIRIRDNNGDDVLDKNGKPMMEDVILSKDGYSVPYYDSYANGGKGQLRRIIFETKNSDVDLQRFREMSRAAIALGSDPMDEMGIRGEIFKSKILDTLFKYKVFDVNKGKMKYNRTETGKVYSGRGEFIKNKGLHSVFGELNKLLYGKNHNDNRRWSYSEIQGGVEKFSYMPKGAKNTFLPQLAESMRGINWSDNAFRKVNEGRLNQIYFDHAEAVNDIGWLKDAMGRATMATTQGRFIKKIFEKKLFTQEGLDAVASSEKDFVQLITEMQTLKDGRETPIMGQIPRDFKPVRQYDYGYRRAYLENLVLKGEDFLINDMSDMASLKSITDVVLKHKIKNKVISRIHDKVDEIKSKSVWAAKERKSLDDVLNLTDADSKKSKAVKEARKAFGLNDKGSAKIDQIQTDQLIREFKADLGTGERELFDMLYLGTYGKGNQKKLDAALRLAKNPKYRKEAQFLYKMLKNTSLIRAGLSSGEIADASVKKFFKNYEDLMARANIEMSERQKEVLMRDAMPDDIKSFRDVNGNLVKNELIDGQLLSETDKIYLDDIAPFVGLQEGKVKDPILRQTYYNIKEHLDHYHNLDVKNLNGLFRGLFKKNLNQANKMDLQTLDRYLADMRNGTWFNRMMDWFTGKSKDDLPIVKRSNYWKFPRAVNRDLLRHPAMMEWVEDVGPYKDKLGNSIENARTVRPTAVIGEIQQLSARTQELSMQTFENEVNEFRDALRPYVSALEDGDILFNIAVAKRELGYMKAKLRPKFKNNGNKLTEAEMHYQENWDKVKNIYNEQVKNKSYVIPTENGNIKMTGEAVINRINNIITQANTVTHKWLTGQPEKINKWLKIAEDSKGEVTWRGLDKLRVKFHDYINDTIRMNKSIPIEELGIDGMRQITKRILISQTPYRMRNSKELAEQRKSLKVQSFDPTGDLGAEYYYPHMSFNRKLADKKLRAAINKVVNDSTLTPEEISREVKKINYQYKNLTGDFMTKDEMGDNFDIMQEALTSQASTRKMKENNILGSNLKKVGNQFGRDAHIGGWDLNPEAYESYMKNAVNTFYKQAMQVTARTAMHNFNNTFFKSSGRDKDLTKAWMNYFKLYTQSAMGYPTHIPEKVMNDPNMRIKGTAYKWLADSTAKKRIDYIKKRLGVSRKELEKWNLDESVIDELSGIEYTQLQSWGSLEAKWQLASLLAHPKSSIANLYGGTVHTWISAGYDNLKKARDFEYLRTNINPKWKSMKDVERWMQELGIIEEFLVHEAGLNPELKSKKSQAFVKDAINKIRKDPALSDEGFLQLSKKHGVTQRIFDVASSFMRVPERVLRRDSFMAHYLQAKNKFGGAVKDYNSPFLINMAKRGVKGTQFLYSAPYRPLWTNSTLGRVMSRFQLWSWNSVRFRNDVIKRAHISGYQEGTPEFDTFKTLAVADAFMLGMASMFQYSLFENALPAPWNWFQDIADYLMGDEEARERAFYGSALGPLQAVTPPSMRLLGPMFKWMMSDDASELTDYYLWTIPPFGRLARDVVGPGGMVENPYYSITKFTGMPIMQAAKLIKGEKPDAIKGKFVY